ncbi:MAG: hypothetical protein KIT56_00730 [Gammaproteobacteria bacterium]|nr:hypothetical protein [Gammaproteobacteria bacterium]
MIETAEMMAYEDNEQHARILFIMNALYGMYLRISELVENDRWTPTMGDFYRDSECVKGAVIHWSYNGLLRCMLSENIFLSENCNSRIINFMFYLSLELNCEPIFL